MNRIFLTLILFLTVFIGYSNDRILLRDGNFIECKVLSVNDSCVTCSPKKTSFFGVEQGVPFKMNLGEVYMIKYEKRGNVYFGFNGERMSGENHKIDKSADIIYLLRGAEIPAWNIRFENGNICFQTSKNKVKAMSAQQTLPISEVFMVVYSDGSKDIFNSFSKPEPQPEPQPEVEEPKEVITLIYHKVKKGDTLSTLSKLYSVSIQEIREWNDLSSKVTPTSRLTPGREFMIYVKEKPEN